MDFQENSFEGIKPSGYYNTAIYDENGNILELRVMKNTLTYWFAINIALYLLSRGRKVTYNSVDYYIVTPTISTGFIWEDSNYFWALTDYPYPFFGNDALHQISPNYNNLAYASGGGFGGAIYLTTLDPPSLGPIRTTPSSVPGYNIAIVGGSKQFHEIIIDNVDFSTPYFHTYYSRRIDCYTSGTGLVLDLQSSNVTASIRGNYTFTESYAPKCILTLSGGRAAETHNYMGSGPDTYQATIANILTFRQFNVNFSQGQTISVEWKIVIQI